MDTSDPFVLALGAFVGSAAKGNKAEAARMLGVARPEIYRYLAGVRPHRAKRERLEAYLATAAGRSPSGGEPAGTSAGAGLDDTVNVSELLNSLRFVIRLIEADLENGRRSGRATRDVAPSERDDAG